MFEVLDEVAGDRTRRCGEQRQRGNNAGKQVMNRFTLPPLLG